MKIEVKNGDAIKAYKVLMKKLKNEGLFDEIKRKRFALSKTEKRREKDKRALIEYKKTQKKKALIKAKQEEWALIEAKKRGRKAKQQIKKQQPTRK